MANPILSLLGQAVTPAMEPLNQVIGMIKAAQNPTAALSQMAQNDERVKNVMAFIQQNGGDPKKAFYALAAQRGVDPNTILSQLK